MENKTLEKLMAELDFFAEGAALNPSAKRTYENQAFRIIHNSEYRNERQALLKHYYNRFKQYETQYWK